eukprot:TRINITY_DN13056_c0_g2_i1.p1 TRINITY_DN13056_c0_g2~~TRINITY_DN13056_c0_g2_i1.p1  ORF type:complete len:800 (+),score=156.66 TRINITY_DN13056_c0_g2_i1:90-2489(+)
MEEQRYSLLQAEMGVELDVTADASRDGACVRVATPRLLGTAAPKLSPRGVDGAGGSARCFDLCDCSSSAGAVAGARTASANAVADAASPLSPKSATGGGKMDFAYINRAPAPLIDVEEIEAAASAFKNGDGNCFEAIVPGQARARWLPVWDVVIVFGLAVVAIYEPYAIALVEMGTEPGFCIVLNFVLDLIFTLDIFLHFFIAYPRQGKGLRAVWETDLCKIAARYCSIPFSRGGAGGWFWLDLLTVTPGWYGALHGDGGVYNALLLLRVVRMFRLLRYKRIADIVERWHTQWGFPFYMMDVSKFLVITIFTCHWLACLWCIVEGNYTRGVFTYTTTQETWLSALISSKGDSCTPSAAEDPFCVYVIAFYWSIMTLTSVGYGDVSPQNKMEYIVAICCMVVGGYVWAYIVGAIVSILSNIDPHSVLFKQNVDDLNNMMERKGLPHDLRVKLRQYMHASKDYRRIADQRRLLEEFVSNGLQREVAAKSPEVDSILRGVWWVNGLEESAVLEIIRALRPSSFAPAEMIPLFEAMMVMRHGVAGVRGRVLVRGDVWGAADVLLETPQLKQGAVPRTMSYVEIFTLAKRSIVEICRQHPLADARIRRAQIRTAVCRAFVQDADRKRRAEQGHGIIRRDSCEYFKDPEMSGGSFAYPGLKWMDRGVESKEPVDLTEIKRLILEVKERQDKFETMFQERASINDENLRMSTRMHGAAQQSFESAKLVASKGASKAANAMNVSKFASKLFRHENPSTRTSLVNQRRPSTDSALSLSQDFSPERQASVELAASGRSDESCGVARMEL